MLPDRTAKATFYKSLARGVAIFGSIGALLLDISAKKALMDAKAAAVESGDYKSAQRVQCLEACVSVTGAVAGAASSLAKAFLAASGWLDRPTPQRGVSVTFETAFGSSSTESWSYKYEGCGPPPPPSNLAIEVNSFLSAPVISLAAGAA